MQIELTDKEWNAVIGVLAQAPWHIANPLIRKIGAQMQAQAKPPLMNDAGISDADIIERMPFVEKKQQQ